MRFVYCQFIQGQTAQVSNAHSFLTVFFDRLACMSQMWIFRLDSISNVTHVVSKHTYWKPSMTSCMCAHTLSYIYDACQMTEKTF